MAPTRAASALTTSRRPANCGRIAATVSGSAPASARIHLDRDDLAGLGQKRQGERAEPGAHLEDHITRRQVRPAARSGARYPDRSRSSGQAAWPAGHRDGGPARGCRPARAGGAALAARPRPGDRDHSPGHASRVPRCLPCRPWLPTRPPAHTAHRGGGAAAAVGHDEPESPGKAVRARGSRESARRWRRRARRNVRA